MELAKLSSRGILVPAISLKYPKIATPKYFNLHFQSARHTQRKCLQVSGFPLCLQILRKTLYATSNHSAYLPNRIWLVRKAMTVEIAFLFNSIRSRYLLPFHSRHLVLTTLLSLRLLHLVYLYYIYSVLVPIQGLERTA